jgi:rhamnosyltransferase
MFKASVIIPLKNGGELFKKVLDEVIKQSTPWPFEVLVIDSGSTDGSDEYCLTFDKVRLHRISASEFGHGKTRNLGAQMTTGEFVVMLTHDALPASRSWLETLVEACSANSEIAGSFGRHLPYPDAFPIVARDLNRHFDHFNSMEHVVRMSDPIKYHNDPSLRQFLHFFSDNNSCLRRSVWEQISYPDVDFAEDQAWAKLIIESGYSKTYCNQAAVYHSHNYRARELLRRSFDESCALKNLFGYDLCPTFIDVVKRTVVHGKDDLVYLRNLQVGKIGPRATMGIYARNFSKYYGHYAGGCHLLHNFFRRFLSLDQALKRS